MTVVKAKKVDIEIVNKDRSITEDTFMVRRLRFDEMTAALTEIHSVYTLVMEDPKLKGVFDELFGEDDEVDAEALTNFTPEELNQIAADKYARSEKRFMKGLMGSFNVLLLHLPQKAGDLLSILAQMDRKVLGQQEYDTILDIYDAVLAVNDLEMMMERGKQSLNVTRQATAFLNKVRTAVGLVRA